MAESRDPDLDQVMEHALSGTAGFFDAMHAELGRRLREMAHAGASAGEMQAAAADILLRFVDPLSGLLTDAGLAAWYRGAGEVAQLLPPAAALTAPGGGAEPPRSSPGPAVQDWDGSPAWLPIVAGAVEDLRSRRLVTREESGSLDDWARGRSFTIAGAHTNEAIQSVRDAIADAVEDGAGVRTFIRRVGESLETSPLGPGRLENVFRTNVAAAYTAGMDRIAEHPIVAEQFPYEEVMPIRDTRLTELCDIISRSGLHGSAVFRTDDPTYQKYRSPRHYQDRCGRRLLTVRAAAAKGIKEAQEWLASGEPPARLAWVPEPDLTPEARKTFEDFQKRAGGVL